MPLTCRRGYSLVELLVAMVMLAGLAALGGAIRLQFEGRLRARSERAGAASALRTAAAVIRAELAHLGTDPLSGADLGPVSAGGITYRAHRGLGAACRIAADSIWLDAAALARWQIRNPVSARDSLLLYRPAGPGGPAGWIPAALLAGPASASCPGGTPALLYSTSLDSARIATDQLPPATLVRWFETSSLSAYTGALGWQLGYTGLSAGAVVQPVAGPLVGPGGFRPALLDRVGLPAAPGAATWLEFRLGGITRHDLAVGPGRASPVGDSLGVAFGLENVP